MPRLSNDGTKWMIMFSHCRELIWFLPKPFLPRVDHSAYVSCLTAIGRMWSPFHITHSTTIGWKTYDQLCRRRSKTSTRFEAFRGDGSLLGIPRTRERYADISRVEWCGPRVAIYKPTHRVCMLDQSSPQVAWKLYIPQPLRRPPSVKRVAEYSDWERNIAQP